MATAKIPFQTRFDYQKGKGNATGDEYDLTRHFAIDKEGRKILVIDGKTNRQEQINSHLDEILIENIVAKASLDPSLLEKVPGMYGDFTEMPKSMFEAQNMVLRLKDNFNQLPVDIREKFNFSAEKYIMSAGTDEWKKNLGMVEEIVEEKTIEETKADE